MDLDKQNIIKLLILSDHETLLKVLQIILRVYNFHESVRLHYLYYRDS